ncbi:carboxypeptidase-like regulatory domain-containing protein [Pelagibacterium limicola]|uniref:carboxypeptidase-like regulatory domain-containing protein n=1 Tax=Pelagibacterium limicola TaxID=2791022 RepID=UPI0018AFC9AE|nr:carboxypeptidase-like regulatory domain-containing protein [Pelagibacterium limicola]
MWRKGGLVLAALMGGILGGCTAPADQSGVLNLSGQLVTGQGAPIAGESIRIVFGSDADPRGAASGQTVTTDDEGRFALTAEVTRKGRTIPLDNWLVRHPSLLLEIGFEMELRGRPALYWVEFDYVASNILRGIGAYLPDDAGNFVTPLTFHDREHAWSMPGDPSGMRMTGIGADVMVEDWEDSEDPEGGPLMLDVIVMRHVFEVRE